MLDAYGIPVHHSLSLVTAPAVEPIATSVAKLHLRVDHSTDDALIDTLCAAARAYVEAKMSRKCITQTWDYKMDQFPIGPLVLPFPPVSSVTSVSYIDSDGASQTWSSSLYDTDLPSGPEAGPARIVPAYGQSFPSTRSDINAVTVRFVCGYGAAATAVPSAVLAAMKLLIGHWYANRESVVVGVTPFQVQQGVDALLWPFRVW